MLVMDADIFASLSREEVGRILSMASPRTVPAENVVFGLGDEAINLFLVEKGAVKLTLPITVAGKTLDTLVEERLPGQLLGWSALVPPHRYTLRASATVDSELQSIPRNSFFDLLDSMPSVGYTVFTNLAAILGERLQLSQTMWIREMQRRLSNRGG